MSSVFLQKYNTHTIFGRKDISAIFHSLYFFSTVAKFEKSRSFMFFWKKFYQIKFSNASMSMKVENTSKNYKNVLKFIEK